MSLKVKAITNAIICGAVLFSGISACSYEDTINSTFENETTSTVIEKNTEGAYTTTTERQTTTALIPETSVKTTATVVPITATTATPVTTTTAVSITATTAVPVTTTTAVPITATTAAPVTTTIATPKTTTGPSEIITYTPEIESDGITLISFNSNLRRNEDATITIQGKPNTEYSIKVHYSSGASTADGLENKISDANGIVTWTWHVGGRTSLGEKNKKIIISGGGEKYTTTFAVID